MIDRFDDNTANTQRLLVETQLERNQEREDRAEGYAQRSADYREQARLAREAAENARAAAIAQAQAQAEQAAQAAAEANLQPPPNVVLPTDDEAPDAAVLVTQDGPLRAELEEQIDGLDIPEELEQSLDNLRQAYSAADELMARGLTATADAMIASLDPLKEQMLDALSVSQEEKSAPATSPLDLPAPAVPNDYFDGHFDTPPPGGWFFGVGDYGRTGQDSRYEWLSQVEAARVAASEHGHYLLAGSDQVTTVDAHLAEAATYPVEVEVQAYSQDSGMVTQVTTQYLGREQAIEALRGRGLEDAAIATYLTEHEAFLLTPEYHSGGESGDYVTPATYGTRADYLQAIGLSANAPGDLQISFNSSGSGGGDAWLDTSHAQGPGRAYVAIVDDQLAGDWVQIGDIGPLGDDIGKMLGQIFEKYGADTPEKQEALRNVLFKYDERFGVLANRDFVAAAVEQNNNRHQGFFESALGRTLLTVAASFIPGVGPYVAIMLNAGFQLSDGVPIGRVIAGAAVSYFAAEYGQQFGEWVSSNLGDSISPAMAEAIAAGARNLGTAAVNQLISGQGLDGKGLLLAAAAGGMGSFMTSFVDGSDFGRALDEQFGRGRAGDILGRLSASAVDGRLSIQDFIGAFGAGRADQVTTVDGDDGTHAFVQVDDGVIAYNPDGSITYLALDDDGQIVANNYDADGNLIVSANAYTGALVDPTLRTATLGDALDGELGDANLGNLGAVLGLPDDVALPDLTRDFDGATALLGDLLSGATPDELAALEAAGFGLDATMALIAPDVAAAEVPTPDLTQQTYTRDANGLETWRNPETGALVYQRAPDGSTLAVVDGRRIVSDPEGHLVSVQGGSFGEAFAQARGSGSAVFEWNGNRYTTVTREDLVRQSGGDVNAYRRYVASTGDVSLEGYSAALTQGKWDNLAQSGIDAAYWQSRGFTPEQVATFYVVNGNDYRLSQLTDNPTVTQDVSSQSMASTIASNIGKLPQGFSDLYASLVTAGSNFLQSQEVGGQAMSPLQAFGAAVNWIANRGMTAAQNLQENTSGAGEAALVVTGGIVNLAWESTGGALQRAYETMTDPNATPQQAAVAAFEFFGAAASVVGATAVVRSATVAAGVTTDGLATASTAGALTVTDAAGILLPHGSGGAASHVDFLGDLAPSTHLSGDIAGVEARIASFDLEAAARHIANTFDDARNAANLEIGGIQNNGLAHGELGSYDIAIQNRFVTYENFSGDTFRIESGGVEIPRGAAGDFEVIHYDPTAPAVLRHEYQHVLDYAAAAQDITSPNLLRVTWPNAGDPAYRTFSFTELNGFRISAEEISQAYVFSAALGDAAGAGVAAQAYGRCLDLYEGMLNRTSAILDSALGPRSQDLIGQTLTRLDSLPVNDGFEVVSFQVRGPDGNPLAMTAQIPAGLPDSVATQVVVAQLTAGQAQMQGYRQLLDVIDRDFEAVTQHYAANFKPPPIDTGGGGGG